MGGAGKPEARERSVRQIRRQSPIADYTSFGTRSRSLWEPALASRPGRIDQAIEFPLPDEEGRRKLVQLYSGGLEVSPPIMNLLVRRTEIGVECGFSANADWVAAMNIKEAGLALLACGDTSPEVRASAQEPTEGLHA